MMKYNILFLSLFLMFSGRPIYGMQESMLAQPNSPSVSLIYYPNGGGMLPGHMEMEVAGTSWTLFGIRRDFKLLASMIDHSTKDGQPFFRFILKATAEQVKIVRKNIEPRIFPTPCSRGALYPLEKAGICAVPSPLNFSPLMTASYLAGSHQLGHSNVVNIEYYGNPSRVKNTGKMLMGATIEGMLIGYVPLIMAYGAWRFAGAGYHYAEQSEQEL